MLPIKEAFLLAESISLNVNCPDSTRILKDFHLPILQLELFSQMQAYNKVP